MIQLMHNMCVHFTAVSRTLIDEISVLIGRYENDLFVTMSYNHSDVKSTIIQLIIVIE